MSDPVVVEKTLTDEVYDALYLSMRRGAWNTYNEDLSESECRSVIGSALWYCRQKYPDLPDHELKQIVIQVLRKEFSEYLPVAHTRRLSERRQHNLAKHLSDFLGTVPWGAPIGIENGLVTNAEVEYESDYESLLAQLNISEMLARLIAKWKHPELALAWVLFKAYGRSIPEILEVFGITEESVGKKEYNALRVKAWRHLSKLDVFAREALMDDKVNKLREFFAEAKMSQD